MGWVDKEKALSYINATAPIAESERRKECDHAAKIEKKSEIANGEPQ